MSIQTTVFSCQLLFNQTHFLKQQWWYASKTKDFEAVPKYHRKAYNHQRQQPCNPCIEKYLMLLNKTVSDITKRAAGISTEMMYQEVVGLLRRTPCTIYDEQIAVELGEPVVGHGLITCEWKNDNPDCHPVTVQFNPKQMRVTGWSDGRTCVGASIFTQPLGEPFSDTVLAEIRERLRQ